MGRSRTIVDQHRSDLLGARSRPPLSDVTPFILLQGAVSALSLAWGGKMEREGIDAAARMALLATANQLEEARMRSELPAVENPLTKLPNRRLSLRELAKALRRSGRRRKCRCADLSGSTGATEAVRRGGPVAPHATDCASVQTDAVYWRRG